MLRDCDCILMFAVDGDFERVRRRVQECPDSVRARSTTGRTALHLAVEREVIDKDGHRENDDNAVEIVELLLEHGA